MKYVIIILGIVGITLALFFTKTISWQSILTKTKIMAENIYHSPASSQKPETFFHDTALTIAHAIDINDIASIKELSKKIEINKIYKQDMTLLWYAGLVAKNYTAVTELIKNGANPNQIDNELGSFIDIAVQAKDSTLLESILNAGVSPDTLNSWGTPLLFTAVCLDSRENLNLLLQRGANIDLKDNFLGRTALYEAISKQCYDQAIYLIENKANVDIATINGVSVAYSVQWDLERQKPGTNTFEKLTKIKTLMIDRGIHFPVDAPQKIK